VLHRDVILHRFLSASCRSTLALLTSSAASSAGVTQQTTRAQSVLPSSMTAPPQTCIHASLFSRIFIDLKIYQANHLASLADRARIARSRQIQKPQAVPALERVRRLHRIDPAVISVHLVKFAGSDAKAKRTVIVLQMQSQTLAKHFATNAKPGKKN
jgi:hypothetical protein